MYSLAVSYALRIAEKTTYIYILTWKLWMLFDINGDKTDTCRRFGHFLDVITIVCMGDTKTQLYYKVVFGSDLN